MTDTQIHEIDEIWKPVLGFEGLYEVSNMGQLRSLDRIVNHKNGRTRLQKGRIFKRTKLARNSPYFRVRLCKDGKQLSLFVHRLVLEAFVGKSNLVCDHLNGNPADNRLSNLQYVSLTENNRRGRMQTKTNVCIHPRHGVRGEAWRVIIQFTVNGGRAKWSKTYMKEDDAIKARDDMLNYFGLESPSGIKNEHFISSTINTHYGNNESSIGRRLA